MDYFNFMKKFLENILQIRKRILFSIICFLAIVGLYYYNSAYVIVRFNELGPITKNMAVYYSGFKVGKITRIEPDNDYKHTLVRVNLDLSKLKLPKNTTVHVQDFPTGELYLQFVYPDCPSLKNLERGDVIEGVAPYSLEEFMLGQNISGLSDVVSLHVIKALNATEVANMEMENFFQNTSKIVTENGDGIKASVDNTAAMTKSLAAMAENLNQTSKKLNNSLDPNAIKCTTSNINDSSANIKETTENIAKATKDIDKTMKKIDDAVSNLNATAENLNYLTGGVNETLSKRGGGIRVLFGKPVKPKR